MDFLSRKETNQVRSKLRKLIQLDLLEARCTYRDGYDTGYPPTETPDAAWLPCKFDEKYSWEWVAIPKYMLMAGGGLIERLENGVIKLSDRYKRFEIRHKDGVKL